MSIIRICRSNLKHFIIQVHLSLLSVFLFWGHAFFLCTILGEAVDRVEVVCTGANELLCLREEMSLTKPDCAQVRPPRRNSHICP